MKVTNVMGLPKALVEACTSDYKYTPHRYSVTAISSGAMQTVLKRKFDDKIEQDVSDMVWLLFGKAVHSVLENSASEGTAEQKLATKLTIVDTETKDAFPVTISGIFDCKEQEGEIVDYKTASTWKVKFGDFSDHEEQITGYAWLYEQTKREKITKGRVVYFLKDYSKGDYLRDPSNPRNAVYVHEFDITEKMKIDWYDKMYKRVLEIEKAFAGDTLPKPCSEEERWCKKGKFAVKKKKTDAKALKLFDTIEEAEDYQKDGCYIGNVIEARPEQNKMCEEYCTCNTFCPFYAEYMKRKTEITYIDKMHKDGDKVEGTQELSLEGDEHEFDI